MAITASSGITRIVQFSADAVQIPFRAAFSHSLATRRSSASVIVKVTSDCGAVGYGEGLPRAYVSGETLATCLAVTRQKLLPALTGQGFSLARPESLLAAIATLLPVAERRTNTEVVANAARCAVEIAVADCLLQAAGLSFAEILPPRTTQVVYSGVISSGNADRARQLAQRMQQLALPHIKIKVSQLQDEHKVRLVREIVGKDVSLRLDANGSFDASGALAFLDRIADVGIDCFEQPVAAADIDGMATLRRRANVPIMADESVVTLGDAQRLIAADACDLFNLRLSKCGGIMPTLALAALARKHAIGYQLGCQVGESAILSAAGRHLAAHWGEVRFCEGSFAELLLSEDVAEQSLAFGLGGKAPLLSGPGLGINVRDTIVAKYIQISCSGM